MHAILWLRGGGGGTSVRFSPLSFFLSLMVAHYNFVFDYVLNAVGVCYGMPPINVLFSSSFVYFIIAQIEDIFDVPQ